MERQTTLPIVEGIASKVDRLVQRVEGVKRGSDIGRPVAFDDRGAAHAASVAAREAEAGMVLNQ